MVHVTLAATPARRTRPRNRRELILTAAARLFAERGYPQVSMSDIAEAVAIGPSALYRHFPGKQQLLGEVILDALGKIRADVESITVADPVETVAVLTSIALDHRSYGVLWHREARHLTEEHREQARNGMRFVFDWLARLATLFQPSLGAAHARMLGMCALSAGASIAYHQLELPRQEFLSLLSGIAHTVLTTEVSDCTFDAPAQRPQPVVALQSRREALLRQSIRIFAERGFAQVSIDDLGATVEMTGAAIYNHFPSKADILVASFHRGNEALWMELNRIADSAPSHEAALRTVLGSYIAVAADYPHIFTMLINESDQLPEAERTLARTSQLSYINEWVHLLRAVHPEIDLVSARITVQAVLTVVNDTVRSPQHGGTQATRAALATIGGRLFGLG